MEKIIEINSGQATEHHPIQTKRGWINAEMLEEGDEIIGSSGIGTITKIHKCNRKPERTLATIQKIENLHQIEGADQIEVADVLGWHVVVKKGEFQIGDFCVYCEVDSILPDKPEFEFLRSRKFRIRTIKLKGQVSQGITFPVDILKEYDEHWAPGIGFFGEVGDDVTELLGITKYDPQAVQEANEASEKLRQPKSKITKYLMKYAWFRKIYKTLYDKKKTKFPKFLHKTDEERLQSQPGVLIKYKDELFYYSEKIDGQSVTFFIKYNPINLFNIFGKNYTFGVCSRKLYMPRYINNNWWNIAKQQNIEQKLKKVKKNICIQGEIIGERIQGNKYTIKGLDFYVFNVFDINKQEYYNFTDFILFCKTFDFKHVPILNENFKLLPSVDEMVDLSKGMSIINTKIQREGIVVRLRDRRFSFKVINPDFLLKFDE